MITSIIKNFINLIPLHVLKNKRFIFCYHDVSENNSPFYSPSHYSTNVNTFKCHLKFFSSECNIVPLDDLLHDENLPKNKIHISLTFDDGFESIRSVVHPILKSNKIPYAIFVNKEAVVNNQLWVTNLLLHKSNIEYLKLIYTNHIKKAKVGFEIFCNNPLGFISEFSFSEQSEEIFRLPINDLPKTYLSLEDLVFLKKEGIYIGSHSEHHYVLSQCLTNLQQTEIQNNQQYLKEALGINPNIFAIPFGKKEHYSNEIIQVANRYCLQYLLSTNVNPYDFSSNNSLIPRIVIQDIDLNTLKFYMLRTVLKKYDL